MGNAQLPGQLQRINLPIQEALPDLLAALAGNSSAVLQAPPGAGKTTLVPLALLDQPWLKNQRIMGMIIIRNFHPDGDDWVGGTVVDPENGKEYKGKIWAIGKDKLGMRGFVGISLIGRTATWTRVP